MKKTVVINLFGSPGAGKSTGAAWLFAQLKMRNINAELVTEFAKDKTWENNAVALSCQEYVFGKQSYKLARCRDYVDVIVTDSPLPLGIIYNSTPHLGEEFNRTIINVFNTYDNMNYFIERDKPYNPIGRNQTELESDRLTDDIKQMLNKYGIQYDTILGTEGAYKTILADVLNYLSWIE